MKVGVWTSRKISKDATIDDGEQLPSDISGRQDRNHKTPVNQYMLTNHLGRAKK